MDGAHDESLVSRRPKRSTAGNRMEAALAELGLEDLTKDIEDDKDFFVEKEEEDIFGSDFESTDEETAQVDADAGEKGVDEEEQRARKVARTRVERTTAIAHARNKATFNPQAQAEASTSAAVEEPALGRGKRRVAFARDPAAEKLPTKAKGGAKGKGKGKGDEKRHSRRTHTVLNTSETASRLKTAAQRRATLPKKTILVQKTYTQSELLARALDTEEGNILEHRGYLAAEEEKRRRARVVRKGVEGPKLRWISRAEEVRVSVPMPPLPPLPPLPPVTAQHPPGVLMLSPASGASYGHYPAQNFASASSSALPTPMLPPQGAYYYAPVPPPMVERVEKVCKNYVVHEVPPPPAAPGYPPPHAEKPSWEATMAALFGADVPWADLKVYSGKARPLSRPKQICPVTGLPAPYLDPRTGVPFANVRAYEVLTQLLNHEYVWSAGLGCYIAREGEQMPKSLQANGRNGNVGMDLGEAATDQGKAVEVAMEVTQEGEEGAMDVTS
ncbi:hypothetical protein FIBSPDRAFT_817483 [Athelia psychrophila]|uniref:Vps72/YL1 C-terminal domain-containing protein n=1 Tax=Athelia psychrophila TaxID=1759441 RepID=A0A166RFZ5_9AGAM|nr:hypothetical protein FIBSPDRAFT_817483 [Fibularhizoctonia sp. CBS 109695]